jgi:CRP-like cAMP-binding protein
MSTSPTLQGLGVLYGVPISARQALTEFGRIHTFPKGTIVVEQGTLADRLHIVVDGELMVTLHGEDELLPLGYVQAGESVGEMSFLEAEALASATVTAHVPSEVWSISGADFEAFLRAHPSAGTEILKALLYLVSRRARRGNERLAD